MRARLLLLTLLFCSPLGGCQLLTNFVRPVRAPPDAPIDSDGGVSEGGL